MVYSFFYNYLDVHHHHQAQRRRRKKKSRAPTLKIIQIVPPQIWLFHDASMDIRDERRTVEQPFEFIVFLL